MIRSALCYTSLVGLLSACSSGPIISTPPTGPRAPTAPASPAPKPPLFHGGVAPKVDSSLPARQLFFGNPERVALQISPDGKRVAYLAPSAGVLNVHTTSLEQPLLGKPVTQDTKRGIRSYSWAHTSRHILYLQDQGGDENWRLFSVDLETGQRQALTPEGGVRASLVHVSPKHPSEIAVTLNERDRRFEDLYKIDLRTQKRTLLHENSQGFAGYLVDDDYQLRLAVKFTGEGGFELVAAQGKSFTNVVSIGGEDSLTTQPVSLDASGTRLYLKDSRQRDKSALVELDLAALSNGQVKPKLLFAPERADVSHVLLHPVTKAPLAASTNYERQSWHAIDSALERDLKLLDSKLEGDADIVSQSLDNQHWIVAETLDVGPVAYHHYDRKAQQLQRLFVARPKLEAVPLAPMHPKVIRSRDGLELVSYLTLPPAADPDGDGKPNSALPMVLAVHGGPWGRDRWGFNKYHQWLASRGYAVLSVNFRGSLGFGKRFVNLANREWAGKMHDDLIDAVHWAIESHVALPDRVAILGGSYGGYSALVGLTFTPEVFACAVDIVGPSNLVTLLQNIPPYWQPIASMLKARVGDPDTEQGRQFLLSRSPLTHVEQIVRPLLIAQGANDPRVKQAESDQIVAAMQQKQIPVVYALYPDEGHGFVRPENHTSSTAITEVFLAQCLGGPYEPYATDLQGSSLTVPVGAEHLWGLEAALENR